MPDCYSDQESQVPIISVYTISTEKGTLNGWLRVKITFNEPLQAFYLVGETDENFELETEEINPAKEGELNQVMLEINKDISVEKLLSYLQAFGEFYASFPESNNCPRSDATNLQILPCGGLGRSDVFVRTVKTVNFIADELKNFILILDFFWSYVCGPQCWKLVPNSTKNLERCCLVGIL